MLGSKSKLTATNSGGGSGSGRQTPGALGVGINSIVCGDCGVPGPCCASINRGILLCSDCGSVHRSLGRHISQVKCLPMKAPGDGRSSDGGWIPEQLSMVQNLYACGANSIWEYSLLNPSASGSSSSSSSSASKSVARSSSIAGSHHGSPSAVSNFSKMRKPKPTDTVTAKEAFIRAKHCHLAFVYKPSKDDPLVTESELSRQLHSSVRTPNLETSLRLISQGADPNYYHPEKNSTPLQVAARAGQAGQVELLLVYGADPGAYDKMGKNAADYAKQASHTNLVSRLINAQYELSDRFSYFLCQKRPDHFSHEASHFLVPDNTTNDRGDEYKIAKRKMQGLNNSVFEELTIDIYDEVDRRETDAIWHSTASNSSTTSSSKLPSVMIPFLPVNPEYGTTRNQGRQKLARLNVQEFSMLVSDVLKEIRRRQSEINSNFPSSNVPNKSPLRETGPTIRAKMGLNTKSLPLASLKTMSGLSDEEPIYDYVASDDDYYHIPDDDEKEDASKSRDNNTTSSNRGSGSGSGTISKRPPSGSLQSRQSTIGSSNSSPAKSSSSIGTSAGSASTAQIGINANISNHSANNCLSSGNLIAAPSTEFKQLKAQLDHSEQKVQALIDSNDDMRSEIAKLTETVNLLVGENANLRMASLTNTSLSSTALSNASKMTSHLQEYSQGQMNNNNIGSHSTLPSSSVSSVPLSSTSNDILNHPGNSSRASPGPKQPPPPPPIRTGTVSMYEVPRPQSRAGSASSGTIASNGSAGGPTSLPTTGSNYMTLQQRGPYAGRPNVVPMPPQGSIQSNMPSQNSLSTFSPYDGSYVGNYDYDPSVSSNTGPAGGGIYSLPQQPPSYEYAVIGGGNNVSENNLPSQEEVVRRTEAITRCIQELLISAKDEKFDAFIPCSERIVRAVTDMVSLFPGTSVPTDPDKENEGYLANEAVYESLATLTDAANHFETECRILIMRSQKEPLHQSFVTQQVIQCAFDIAKSTKQLVAQFQ